ncbi:unnamed protein product [Rhizophagus irregularis]|uniref:Uncharacterized protein n=1 Tax=Rhizophagus irregularis TaxID=588596 RepID=A0A916EH59_9GLOM|nr:unnamed protein product [Rhizophagus irregularis]CAB5388006.1 unnamed protein product [Rhizophagus irregularis]
MFKNCNSKSWPPSMKDSYVSEIGSLSKRISLSDWLHVVARWAAGNFLGNGNPHVIDIRIAIQASPLMVMTGFVRGGPFPPIPLCISEENAPLLICALEKRHI